MFCMTFAPYLVEGCSLLCMCDQPTTCAVRYYQLQKHVCKDCDHTYLSREYAGVWILLFFFFVMALQAEVVGSQS